MIRIKVFFTLALCFSCFSQVVLAQAPVVNTTISVDKTGSEPFDSTTWDGNLATAGTDEDAENNVVRLQDSITYRVEVSVNDADVDDLTATVRLLNNQTWINIPTGCMTDPADVTAQPVSSISADGTELFCNLGPAVEGTTKVFFPPARAIGIDPLTGDITLNDSIVRAQVEAGADGVNNLASDGDTEVIVTAFFRVDTIKEPKVNATDPDTGAFLYKPVVAMGPNGELGTLMEYRITARYVRGSMIADSDEVTFESDYDLFDFYTDDNENNNAAMIPTPNPPAANPAATLAGPFSTGGILYTWDPATPACSLDGNHGANATVTCIQNNSTPSDFTAPNAPVGGYAGDGINDPTIDIDLDRIDVRDPDGDANLFEVIVNVWFNNATDIRTHQSCNPCINTILQDVGVLDAAGNLDGFNPESTEDASGNNLLNYNGTGEPVPNRNIFPMAQARTGSYSTNKTFTAASTSTLSKFLDQEVPAGSTVPLSLEVIDRRFIDQAKTQFCDKIDTSVYELLGLGSGLSNARTTISNNGNFPVNIRVRQAGASPESVYVDGSPFATALYSNLPHTDALGVPLTPGTPTGSSAADQNPTNLAWHTSLRDSTCPDDLNNDGIVNIKPAGAPPPDPAAPVDWYEDEADIPGGVETTTRFRGEITYDSATVLAINPALDLWQANFELDLRVKSLANGYGDRNMLPNWKVSRRTSDFDATSFRPWEIDAQAVDDLDFVNFAVTPRFADRNVLVPNGHSIEKYTNPRGIKVVRAGDIVQFVVEPRVFGLWPTTTNTARVRDNLPPESTYLANSEEFSTDGGVTWLNRADYDATGPAITITSAPHAPGADPLDWRFGSVDSGEQLPLIRYLVQLDSTLVSGTFTNTADIRSDLDPTERQRYRLTILPQFGLDVTKSVDYPVFEVNEPFEFDLIYRNLGGEA